MIYGKECELNVLANAFMIWQAALTNAFMIWQAAHGCKKYRHSQGSHAHHTYLLQHRTLPKFFQHVREYRKSLANKDWPAVGRNYMRENQ